MENCRSDPSSEPIMRRNGGHKEGRESKFCSSILAPMYGCIESEALRSLLRRLVLRMEGGAVYSLTIREIYRRFHGVDVGLYTIGPCDVAPGNLAPGTTVGRYSSIYYTVQSITRDHPSGAWAAHGLFCDSALGKARNHAAPRSKLVIGNDVWAGHNAIILPSVEQIGDGAVIGAGSVVHNNVPPYAVVTGNPARVVRYRFSEKKINELIESKWWLKCIDELSGEMDEFQKPLEGAGPIR